MAETSRSRVTITLGRSGQVVKRAGPAVDGTFSDSHPAAGSKRSVRDRLGGSDVDGAQFNSKRQRGDGVANSVGVKDMRLGKGDLRFKLMRKNVLRQVQSDGKQNGVDLRDTLSREIRSSTSNPNMRQRMPEPTRLHISEPMDVSIFSRIPSTRSADALPQIDSLRNSYSPWTLDRLRRRSPDETFRTSRGRSPRRNEEELPKRPLMRIYDDVRTVPYMSKDVLEPSRPKGSSPFVTKSTVSSGPVKAVAPPPPPSSSIVQEKFIHSTDY